ncbi:MAG: RNA pyrophosphohydrolase [Chromatiales bacterium]|nr:RNA pyrophosphohydrolase [Chromatiales bacterium]
MDQIDEEGFRANVGIIVCDSRSLVLVGGRVGQDAWQFPQGGIRPHESPEEAMYRELREEIGLAPDDVSVLGSTSGWLRYRLPEQYVRRKRRPLCIGQKQRWFLLRLLSAEDRLRLDTTRTPEFDRWRWVEYWQPMRDVIYFKREVYRQALHELGPIVFPEGLPSPTHGEPDGGANG